ncbi:hypothetical protein IMZ48_47165 [Candidatus Bathyarchaeota archaeon]|nr:hypothetical protein [Candidatus Bathyarchaeota archaeon]
MSSDTEEPGLELGLPTEALNTVEPATTTATPDIQEPGLKLIITTEALPHAAEPTTTTAASDTEKPGRKSTLPTEALIHTVEPTTTTTTKPVAYDPRRHSRERSNSRDALSALTRSPSMSSSSSLKAVDYSFPFPSRPQTAEHDTPKTDESGYEAFPSFESWTPPSRFSLTRSLSLRTLGSQTAQAAQAGRRRMFRALTTTGPPTRGEAQPRSLGSEAERVAWMGEELSRTQVCLWAGPWRRMSSGDFTCPCGEHSLRADSAWAKSLEDRMRGLIRGGASKKGE